MSALKYLDPFPLLMVSMVVIIAATSVSVVLPLVTETVIRVVLAVLFIALLVTAGLWIQEALEE